jgi:hypothetical protein
VDPACHFVIIILLTYRQQTTRKKSRSSSVLVVLVDLERDRAQDALSSCHRTLQTDLYCFEIFHGLGTLLSSFNSWLRMGLTAVRLQVIRYVDTLGIFGASGA